MATTVRAEFLVLGTFDPDQVAKRLGIQFTRIWRKGDSKSGTLLRYETDGAGLSTGDREEVGVGGLIQELLLDLEPRKDCLSQLCGDTDASLAIDCCVYLESGEAPEIHLSREVLSRLSALGLSVDIDVILLGDD